MHDVVHQAKKWFDARWPGQGKLEFLLRRCTAWGIVYKTPDTFLIAEPAYWDGWELSYQFATPNVWWVHWCSGKLDLRLFMGLAGEPLPYIGWERNGDGKLRVYKWSRAIKHG